MASVRGTALGLAAGLVFALVLGSSSGRSASVPRLCPPSALSSDRVGFVRVAECDQCRTSGPRAGFKRCCELVGGDYVCRWVRC